ncbi:MAG: hypothetical protein ACP5I4_01900 [Oceanipulchritudo sp.]
MKSQHLLPLAAIAVITTGLQAQLVITSGNQSTTIDFQSNVGFDGNPDTSIGDNVYKYSTGNRRSLIENDNSAWDTSWNTGDWGMSADAWSWGTDNLDLGMGVGLRTQFGDYNNDSDLVDALNTINAVSAPDLSTLGLGSAGDIALDIGNNGRPFRDYTLTLRVHNISGSAIDQWSFSLDTWYADDDADNATASILWSTDNVNFSSIDSYTTTNTGGIAAFIESDLSGTINASVANGGYLYLQFATVRGSGSGARTVIDNWTITASSGGPVPVAPVGVAVAIAGPDVELTFDTVDGLNYQLLVSTDDMATFNPVGESGSSGTGDGSPLTLTDPGGTPATGERVFYKVEAN